MTEAAPDRSGGQPEINFRWGDKEINIRRYDAIKIATAVVCLLAIAAVGAVGWALYQHMEDTKVLRREEISAREQNAAEEVVSRKESAAELALAIREFASSQRELAFAVRLQTCIGAVPQAEKLDQVIKENSYCQRATK